jgi:predicted DNA-binding transcriptional regulator AlpA
LFSDLRDDDLCLGLIRDQHGTESTVNTVFALLAQYGARAVIPLEEVRKGYFSDLSVQNLQRKIQAGEIALRFIRLRPKIFSGVHILDLAEFIDRCRVEGIEGVRPSDGSSSLLVGAPAQASVEEPDYTARSIRDVGERLLMLKEVKWKVSLSRADILHRIDEGTFPPQVRGDETVSRWRMSDVDAWIAGRRDWQ